MLEAYVETDFVVGMGIFHPVIRVCVSCELPKLSRHCRNGVEGCLSLGCVDFHPRAA